MSQRSTAARDSDQLFQLPSHPVAYVAILAAVVSAAIHLMLAPRLMNFNQTVAYLFYLNAAGWIGGVLLYLTRYWRRELYVVAAGYALVTIVAFFVQSGRLMDLAIVSKVAEVVVVLAAGYLYLEE